MNYRGRTLMKFINIASAASLLFLPINANAAIIDNGAFTTDTLGGLDWLDLTETRNRSYVDVSTKLGAGDEFAGWRYASELEVSGFFDAFGGDNTKYNGSSVNNNGLFDNVAPLWGDNHCAIATNECLAGEGYSAFYTDVAISPNIRSIGVIYDDITNPVTVNIDYINLNYGTIGKNLINSDYGHALVRVSAVSVPAASAVPVPAAVWLFGSGLVGLIAVAKRKARS